MKHRLAAITAAFAIVAAGALASPAVDAPASEPAALPGGATAPAQTVGDPDRPAPPRDVEPVDLTGVTVPGADATLGDGALSTVVDAITEGDGVPGALADQVVVEGDRIRVEVTVTDDDAARDAIAAAGGTDVYAITDTLFAASIPADAIADVEADSAVTTIGLPALASPPAPSFAVPSTVGTKGDDVYQKTNAASWHKIGIKGTGVKVGIIDYYDRAIWRDARSKGDVPNAAGTFCRWGGRTCSVYDAPALDAHGVAVAEAIHDMAPRASLYLAKVATNEDLKKAIDYFASKGVKIISRSLGGFYDGPGNGTGASASLVTYAVKKGMVWFNAAGNSGAYTETYSDGSKDWVGGYFRQQWRDTNNNGWMEFAHNVLDANGVPTGAVTYSETMDIWCSPYFRLRWNDWGVTNPTDYNIYRINTDGSVRKTGYAPNTQSTTKTPLELQNGSDSYFGCSSGWISVGIKRMTTGNGYSDDILELAGNSGDIWRTASSAGSAGEAFIDSKNPGMAAVGAVDPVDGIAIAGYSSQGPTNDGRIKPEISAGSNFTSRAYTYTGQGGRFNGTSAATPVVAGAAALVLQRNPSYTPAKVVEYLRTKQTTDRGVAGIDNVFGTGELVMTPIPVASFTTTPAPTISGTRAVGSTLTAVKPAFSPRAETFTYQWQRNGKAISGATKSTYKLTSSDGGQRIRVAVTGKRGGFHSVTTTSSQTAVIAKLFVKAPTPKITGTVKVARTLKVSVGTWSPKPSFTYQWKVNGKSVKGATKTSYKVKSSDAGKRITVTVTAKKSGYKTTAKTSKKTTTVAR